MKISESAQEQLERLWIATEEEPETDSAIQDTAGVNSDEMVQLGLVERSGSQVTLTASGRLEAAQAVRRHRLAERLLADVLATEEGVLDERACRLEHALFDGVDDSICTLLGHPRFCPHGKPIPQGECCRQKRESVDRLIAPLGELQPGQHGHIAYVQMNDPGHLQKLMAMGVLPQVPITLIRRFPSFVFEAGYSQFAVDEEMAATIYVRLARE